MVKKSIFTLIFLTVMGWASAQSLRFEWNGQVYSEGETVECNFDEFGYGEFIQHAQLRNLTSGDLNVIVEKEVIEDLEGAVNFFCWGSCYGPDVFVSPNPVMVEANTVTGENDLSFHVMYEESLFGKVRIKYSAYDERHPSERVTIIVLFNKSGTGVHEIASARFGQAYPNPASSAVNFDYSIEAGDNASVSVYNLLGQEMLSQPLNSLNGRLSISVSDLNDGIYFCKLFVDGCAVKTEKFVIKK